MIQGLLIDPDTYSEYVHIQTTNSRLEWYGRQGRILVDKTLVCWITYTKKTWKVTHES